MNVSRAAPAAASAAILARAPSCGQGWAHSIDSPASDARIRGATQIAANSVPAMEEAVVELCREIEQRNEIGPADIVWAIFTVTRDLDADFPRAAPHGGLDAGADDLLAGDPGPGSMPRIVRVLLHVDSAARGATYLAARRRCGPTCTGSRDEDARTMGEKSPRRRAREPRAASSPPGRTVTVGRAGRGGDRRRASDHRRAVRGRARSSSRPSRSRRRAGARSCAAARSSRASPYTFQGLGEEGLNCCPSARHRPAVVTEVMTRRGRWSPSTPTLQIGARNMQNYDLLRAAADEAGAAQARPVGDSRSC